MATSNGDLADIELLTSQLLTDALSEMLTGDQWRRIMALADQLRYPLIVVNVGVIPDPENDDAETRCMIRRCHQTAAVDGLCVYHSSREWRSLRVALKADTDRARARRLKSNE